MKMKNKKAGQIEKKKKHFENLKAETLALASRAMGGLGQKGISFSMAVKFVFWITSFV